MYTPKGSRTKSDAIKAARAIASGDVQTARRIVAQDHRAWRGRSPAEARAIIGACRYALTTYGVVLAPESFLYPFASMVSP